MNQLISNQKAEMTSREIADLVGARHDSVKRTIERLSNCAIDVPPLVEYLDSLSRPAKQYLFSGEKGKLDSIVVIAQLCPEFTARIIKRWDELERANAQPKLPQTYAEALLEAGRLALENEKQAEQLRLAAPKVEFVEKYIDSSTGSLGFRKVAKLLKVNEKEFRSFLNEEKIMYKLGGDWVPYQNHIDAGRFEVKAGFAEHEESSHAFTQSKFTAKGVEWIAGEYAKHKINKQIGGEL